MCVRIRMSAYIVDDRNCDLKSTKMKSIEIHCPLESESNMNCNFKLVFFSRKRKTRYVHNSTRKKSINKVMSDGDARNKRSKKPALSNLTYMK